MPELEYLHAYLKDAAIDNPTSLGQRAIQIAKKSDTILQYIMYAASKTRKRSRQKNLLNGIRSYLVELADYISGE